jgi:hypothetical protein
MAKDFEKAFKNAFVKKNQISITKILEKTNSSSIDQLKIQMQNAKLSPYYDIEDPNIQRNSTPTRWENIKRNLKEKGKWILGQSIPIAIGLATGSTGIGLIAGPIIATIIQKIQARGLNTSEEFSGILGELIESKSGEPINKLTEKLKSDNENTLEPSVNLDNAVNLAVMEEITPFISELHATLAVLQVEKSNLHEVLDEWMFDQQVYLETIKNTQTHQTYLTQELLNQFEAQLMPMIAEFDVRLSNIETNISEINQNFRETTTSLLQIQQRLEGLFTTVSKIPFEELSIGELLQISRIQFMKMKLAGKFSQPFDMDLYIHNPVEEAEFANFLTQSTPLFLLLAQIGMGKTWTAVYLANYARGTRLAIPFFIPIHLGFDSVLKDIFNIQSSGLANEIGQICEKISKKYQIRVLFVFDGLDEYPETNRQPFFNFLEQLIQGYKDSILILLTDRIADWIHNDFVLRAQKTLKNIIYPNNMLIKMISQLKINTPVSGLLSGFSQDQLGEAIIKYGLDSTYFSAKLLELCQAPFILRIVHETKLYPNPDNPAEFLRVFHNPEDPFNTILYRMNIVGSTENLFFSIIDAFGDARAVKTEKDLLPIYAQKDEQWQTIISSGILVENARNPLNKTYHFEAAYQNVINYILAEAKATCEEVEKVTQQPCPTNLLSPQPTETGFKAVLSPILREQGVIKAPPGFDALKKGDTIMVSSKYSPNPYSFLITILDVETTGADQALTLLADSRKTGPLKTTQHVDLIPIAPKAATMVTIGLDKSHIAITPGNWTESLIPQLKGKAFDFGDKITTALSIGTGMIMLKGFLYDCSPIAPITITRETQIELIKLDDQAITKKMEQLDSLKKNRK